MVVRLVKIAVIFSSLAVAAALHKQNARELRTRSQKATVQNDGDIQLHHRSGTAAMGRHQEVKAATAAAEKLIAEQDPAQPPVVNSVGIEGECTPEKGCQKCIWKDWSEWSKCSETCGGGDQGRRREILAKAQNGGDECQGPPAMSQACGEDPCPTTTGEPEEETTSASAEQTALTNEKAYEEKQEQNPEEKQSSNQPALIGITVMIVGGCVGGVAYVMGQKKVKYDLRLRWDAPNGSYLRPTTLLTQLSRSSRARSWEGVPIIRLIRRRTVYWPK